MAEDTKTETTPPATKRRDKTVDPAALPRGFEDPSPDQKKYDGGAIPKSSRK